MISSIKIKYFLSLLIINVILISYISSSDNNKKYKDKNFKYILQENIQKIDISNIKRENIINVFGNPLIYKGSQICKVEGVILEMYPQSYWMIYSDDFKIHISNYYLDYIQLNMKNFELPNGVKIGMNFKEVFKIIDKPDQIIKENAGSKMIKGALYEYYENSFKNNFLKELKTYYGYHFVNGILKTIYIYNTVNHFTDFCSSIQEKLNKININNTKLIDLIEILGEPISYEWSDGVYTIDNLPETYLITYPGVIHFMMEKENIKVIKIFGNYYTTSDGIKVDMDLNEVIRIYGNPNNIIEFAKYNDLILDNELYKNTNVLYKNIDGTIGFHSWKLNNKNILLFFSNNKIHNIILF